MSARQPDQVYQNGAPVPAERVWWREIALAIPNLAKLLMRLAKDNRVPPRSKTFAGFTAAYLISPIDVVPDFIPFLGKMDDIVLVAFALNHLIQTAGYDVVREHWDGEDDVLDMVVDIVDFAAGLVPRTIRVALNRMLRG